MAEISDGTVFFEADASNNTGTNPGWPEGMLPSRVNDAARALQGGIKRFWDRINPTLESTGTANAQLLTYTVAPASYVTGEIYSFVVGSGLTNTGATTLDINGLGARSIKINGVDLIGGELNDGRPVSVMPNATDFELIGPLQPTSAGFTPANPTGTSSATLVMMGVGGTVAFTPRASGRVEFIIAGTFLNDTGITQIAIRYGTGTAPVNGAAVTGTAVGATLNPSGVAVQTPFTILGRATGLTIGTAYWADVALNTSGGTVVVADLSVIIRECSV